MTELNKIEQEIFNAISIVTKQYFDLPKDQQGSNAWLTKQIKLSVGELGKKKGYSVSSTEHDGEWLYDLCWWQNDEKGNLESIPLVLECELSDRKPAGLKYDFEKLLNSNSETRVFVCFNEGNMNYPTNINNLITLFNEWASAYNHLPSGSRLLVLIWDDFYTGKLNSHLIIR